jgi:hypothetical protein
MTPTLRNNLAYRALDSIRGFAQWRQRDYAAPSPHAIKQATILRNGYPNATWVETGTYMGQTTRLLTKHAKHVFSLEPEPKLFANAAKYFKSYGNVEILNGTSEAVLPSLLPKLTGEVNFWLDGHYSAGVTYQGQQDTPVLDELKTIEQNLSRFKAVCVLVDDLRCFDPENPAYAGYPSLDALVDWARSNNLKWHIEHDIFCAKTR